MLEAPEWCSLVTHELHKNGHWHVQSDNVRMCDESCRALLASSVRAQSSRKLNCA